MQVGWGVWQASGRGSIDTVRISSVDSNWLGNQPTFLDKCPSFKHYYMHMTATKVIKILLGYAVIGRYTQLLSEKDWSLGYYLDEWPVFALSHVDAMHLNKWLSGI